jgi:hypothetical protein
MFATQSMSQSSTPYEVLAPRISFQPTPSSAQTEFAREFAVICLDMYLKLSSEERSLYEASPSIV